MPGTAPGWGCSVETMGLDSIDNALGEGERSNDIHGLQMKKPRMCQCRAGAEEYSGLEATEMSLKSAPFLRDDRNHGEEDRMPGHTCPESSRKCRKSISPSRLQKAIAVQKASAEGTDKQDARH